MTVADDDIQLKTTRGGARYVRRLADGSEAELAWFEQGPDVVVVTHTETPRQHRGQGIAAALVERAVADFRAAGKRIVPACPYVRAQFAAHPEWADLLHRR